MGRVEKIDKGGMYGAEREIKDIECTTEEVEKEAKMNIRARNKLLIILKAKGIEIRDLEIEIEEAYENYYKRGINVR